MFTSPRDVLLETLMYDTFRSNEICHLFKKKKKKSLTAAPTTLMTAENKLSKYFGRNLSGKICRN